MHDYDFIFISETHCNGMLLPDVTGYKILSDPAFPLTSSQGGQAVYVSEILYPSLISIRFTKCTISFAVSTIPKFNFMSVYINPINSNYYSLNDFGLVSEEISFWKGKGFTAFIGGDFNARLGDLNEFSERSLKWRYDVNIDSVSNSHGAQLKGICELHKILPLNHCRYYNHCWDGKFTFHNAGRQSQIDFCLTTCKGKKCVTNFEILEKGWHFSDHLPVSLSLLLPLEINIYSLLLRANDLGESSTITTFKSYRFTFNAENAKTALETKALVIMDSLQEGSPDGFLEALESTINPILKCNKIKRANVVDDNDSTSEAIKLCDDLYLEYVTALKNSSHDCNDRYTVYQVSRNKRNKLNASVFSSHERKYKSIIQNNDDRMLWKNINWSGKYNSENNPKIPIQVMADYFEKLYEPLDLNETKEMESLHTNTYIPITDDPITAGEVNGTYSKMRKGGYDYSLEVLKLLMKCISPAILIFLNLLFYVSFPVKLATSMLSAIPKKVTKN